MKDIYDINIASSVLLERLKTKSQSDYENALELASIRIEQAILRTKGNWTRTNLLKIQSLIKDEIMSLYGGLFESIKDESVAVAEINYNAILGNASIAAALPKTAVNDLINSNRMIQMSPDSQYFFKDLIAGTLEQNERVLRTTLAGLVASGATPTQIANDLTFKSNKLSKGQMRSNIFTIITDAKNQGNYEAYSDYEKRGLIKYYEHVSVLDSKTSDICRRTDGAIYRTTLDKIPTSKKPPLHSNCRSQLSARTNNNTLRDSDETLNGWIDRQPKTFQRDLFGKNYNAYKAGNYKVNSVADLKSTPISIKQYQDRLFKYLNS